MRMRLPNGNRLRLMWPFTHAGWDRRKLAEISPLIPIPSAAVRGFSFVGALSRLTAVEWANYGKQSKRLGATPVIGDLAAG